MLARYELCKILVLLGKLFGGFSLWGFLVHCEIDKVDGTTDYFWGRRTSNTLSNQKLNGNYHVNTNGEIIKMFRKTTFSQGTTKNTDKP